MGSRRATLPHIRIFDRSISAMPLTLNEELNEDTPSEQTSPPPPSAAAGARSASLSTINSNSNNSTTGQSNMQTRKKSHLHARFSEPSSQERRSTTMPPSSFLSLPSSSPTPMLPKAPPMFSVHRIAYCQERFDATYAYQAPPTSPFKGLRRTVSRAALSAKSICSLRYFLSWIVLEHFPIIDWVYNYNVRQMMLKDVLAGITCGVMQIPQGMAAGMPSGAGPIAGLYTAFIPTLVYSAFATSRHLSVGAYSVISVMVAAVIRPNLDAVKQQLLNSRNNNSSHHYALLPGTAYSSSSFNFSDSINNSFSDLKVIDDVEFSNYAALRIATAVCLASGLILFALGIFRLGFIACYLSDALIAGSCAGAAVQIFVTQLFPMTGLKANVNINAGWLSMFYNLIDLFKHIGHANYFTCGLSIICVVVMYVVKEYVNGNRKIMKKLYNIPIPVELLLVIVSTLLSYYCNFPGPTLQIKTIAKIPLGLPSPSLPDFEIASRVFVQSILIAFVIITLTISLGRLLAKKNNTPLDPSAELRALGLCNIAGACFSCIPAVCVMGRTMILAGIGMQSQLTSFVGCAIVFIVLQWLGKLLEPVPDAVVASILVVALKPLFMTVTECWRLLHVSWLDASIYVVTFVAIIMSDVSTGILIGVGYSILSIVLRTQYPHVYVLGRILKTELYTPLGEYRQCAEITGVRILQISAPIYFANVDYIGTRLIELVYNTDKYRAFAAQKASRRTSRHQTPATAAVSRNSIELRQRVTIGSFNNASTIYEDEDDEDEDDDENVVKVTVGAPTPPSPPLSIRSVRSNSMQPAVDAELEGGNDKNDEIKQSQFEDDLHVDVDTDETFYGGGVPNSALHNIDAGGGGADAPAVINITAEDDVAPQQQRSSLRSSPTQRRRDSTYYCRGSDASSSIVSTTPPPTPIKSALAKKSTSSTQGKNVRHQRWSLNLTTMEPMPTPTPETPSLSPTTPTIPTIIVTNADDDDTLSIHSIKSITFDKRRRTSRARSLASGISSIISSTRRTSAAVISSPFSSSTNNITMKNLDPENQLRQRRKTLHWLQPADSPESDPTPTPTRLSFVTEMAGRSMRAPSLAVLFSGVRDNDTELDETVHNGSFAEAVVPHHVIIDCSSITFMDTAGVRMLIAFVRECDKKAETKVFFSRCPRNVREQIHRNQQQSLTKQVDIPESHFFPTTHEAVLHSIAEADYQVAAEVRRASVFCHGSSSSNFMFQAAAAAAAARGSFAEEDEEEEVEQQEEQSSDR